MTIPLHILLVEDSADDANLLLRELRRGGYEPVWERVDTADALSAALARQEWDVITCDYVMPRLGAAAALEIIRQGIIDAPVIIVSGEVGEEVAVAAMKAGAVDFVSKHRMTRLVPAIQRELREAEDRRARRRAEEALGVSTQRLRDVVDTSHDLIWSVDAEGRFTFVSQAAQRLLGYAPEALLGRSFTEFFSPEHLGHGRDLLARIQAGTDVTGEETEVLRKDGQRVVMRSNATILRRADGRVAGAAGTSADITAQRRADEERARLSAAVEQAQDSVMITAADGTIVYVNPAFERLTGYTRAEIYGRKPQVLRADAGDDNLPRDVCALLARGEAWKGTDAQRRKDGTSYQLEVTISPVHDLNGRLINLVGIGHNVTRERQLDAQLRHTQRMEAAGRLAAGVAHEFNNQLTIVKGSAQLLLTKLGPAEAARRDAERITTAVDRSARLAHQLLTFGRQRPPETQPLNLTDVLNETTPMLRLLLGEQLTLRVVAAPNVGAILADRSQIEQLLVHLVTHARDALAPDGQPTTGTMVWLETANATLADVQQYVPHADGDIDAHVRLTVRDDGPPIAAAAREHIFEPFHSATELGRGTGLDLATVFRIVQQHHGYIACSSEADHGTAFHLYWPATVSRPAPALPPQTGASTGREAAATPATILVVEDEGDVRALLVRALMQAGHRVYSAATANEALAVAESMDSLDLLVTDVVMPGDSGAVLAHRLRRQRPEVPVLFISGHLPDGLDLADLPGSRFLAKPFGLNDLFAAVTELLARRASTGR